MPCESLALADGSMEGYAELLARARHMRECFDTLSERMAQAHAHTPAEEGLAEIDAAVRTERKGKQEIA